MLITMSDAHNNATIVNGSCNDEIDEKDLLEFKLLRERTRKLGEEGKTEEVVALYDMHSQSSKKFYKMLGYKSGEVIADAVFKIAPNPCAKILDCASGDGVVGSNLQKFGYTTIDALDPSPAMIEECRRKNIYTNLVCDFVKHDHTTQINNETYDVIAASAAFCPGHMNQSCFHELTRLTKPGGYIVFNISTVYLQSSTEFKDGKFAAAVLAMVMEGLWQSVETFIAPYFTKGIIEDCVIFTVKTAQKKTSEHNQSSSEAVYSKTNKNNEIDK